MKDLKRVFLLTLVFMLHPYTPQMNAQQYYNVSREKTVQLSTTYTCVTEHRQVSRANVESRQSSNEIQSTDTIDSFFLRGIASQYGAGRMESVIRVRQQPGRTSQTLPDPLPEADVFFAIHDCEMVGKMFEIRRVYEDGNKSEWETALATDCASPQDGGLGFMLFNNEVPLSVEDAALWIEKVNIGEYSPAIVAEVDFSTAERWGVVGRGQLVEIRNAPLLNHQFDEESLCILKAASN